MTQDCILISPVRNLLRHFLGFFDAIFCWELLIFWLIHGSLEGFTPYYLLFIPAQALVLAAFSTLTRSGKSAGVATALCIAALTVYYLSQMLYYRIFGSLYSVSMLGVGGDAVRDFGWALWSVVKKSFGWIFLFCLPAALAVLFLFFGEETCRGKVWPACLAALLGSAVLWCGATAGLAVFGTSSSSAYYACHNPYTDTDTTAYRLGALTCTMLEAGVPAPAVGTVPVEDSVNALSEAELSLPEQEPTEELPEPVVEESVEEVPEEPDFSPRVTEGIDFEALAALTEDEELAELCAHYASVEPTCRNEYTGMFAGYNLIYICAEAFSSYAVDPEVTPTLYKLANEGIVLTNYYNSFKNTTTNGEFAFLTGLWPDVSRQADSGSHSGSMSESAKKYMPYGLGTLFNEQGCTSRGYHNYLGTYYNRNHSLPNLGFVCKFMNDGMTFSGTMTGYTSRNLTSDLEMMEQSVDDYINEDRFCAYYMTFSGHGPYDSYNPMRNKNIDTVQELTADRTYNDSYCVRSYLAAQKELDKALEYLLQRLEEAGKLENTVIVLCGDHYPYYMTGTALQDLEGGSVDYDFGIYDSTCILWNGGMEEPLIVDEPCCNVDILPTVLNLFDIEYDSRLFPGKDILADTTHAAVLYNKNFITDKVRYTWSSGKAEWLIDTSAYTQEELDAYLEAMKSYVSSNYAACLQLLDTDFYRFVWENSGMTSLAPDPLETE